MQQRNAGRLHDLLVYLRDDERSLLISHTHSQLKRFVTVGVHTTVGVYTNTLTSHGGLSWAVYHLYHKTIAMQIVESCPTFESTPELSNGS